MKADQEEQSHFKLLDKLFTALLTSLYIRNMTLWHRFGYPISNVASGHACYARAAERLLIEQVVLPLALSLALSLGIQEKIMPLVHGKERSG